MKLPGRGRRKFLADVRNAVIAAAMVPDARAQPATAAAPVDALRVLAADDAQMLLRVCRRVLPLDGVSDAAFWSAVMALDANAAEHVAEGKLLMDGARAMRNHLGEGWATAPDAAIDAYLESAQGASLLQPVLAVAVPVFVALPEVWAVVGYEGESLSKGGYLRRGFNDLAWLPEPSADAAGPVP